MDQALVEVLRVSLNETAPGDDPPIHYLQSLAQELEAEGSPRTLAQDNLDRVLMARLVEAPPAQYPQEPVPYLMGCYQRAYHMQQRQHSGAASAALHAAQEQLANFIWLAVSPTGIVPQAPALEQRGMLQLFDALWSAAAVESVHTVPGAGTSSLCTPLPPGLLSRLAAAYPDDFGAAVDAILQQLATKANLTSILGDTTALVNCWFRLLESKATVAAVTESPWFLPVPRPGAPPLNGRAFQMQSALAALTGISFLADDGAFIEAQPSVREQCFAALDPTTQPTAARNMAASLHIAGKALVASLSQLISPKALLAKEARPRTLRWIAAALAANQQERAKMQVQGQLASSDGFAFNLCRVLLNLCAPFLDFNSGKARQFIDPRYMCGSGLVRFEGDSRLAADEEAYRQWQARTAAEVPAGSYHFITECFFMTGLAMHLGIGKILDAFSDNLRVLHELERLVQGGGPPDPNLTRQYQRAKHKAYAVDFATSEADTVAACAQWCELMAAWLLHLATGAAPAAVALPLPTPPPLAFRMVPEYLLQDMCAMLKQFAAAGTLGAGGLENVVLCCTALMSSPDHVTNPYLRYCCAEVLYYLMPDPPGQRRRRSAAQAADVEALFTVHPAVSRQLIPGLLSLYKDIEYTERANQFNEKFSMRGEIAELLAWLWNVPQHREAWKAIAAENQGRGLYMSFLNYLVNDCIFLLDESMKKLPEIKEKEALQEQPEWQSMGPLQQRQHLNALHGLGSSVRFYLAKAGAFIGMLVYTSAEIAEPFLLPEMANRVAEMLNYFLRHLTGPDRSKLKVSNAAKYGFNPKELLAHILRIFMHLRAADTAGRFVTAIAEDGMSYRPENFSEAVRIAVEVGLPGFDGNAIAALELLAERVAEVAEQQRADDAVLEDVPDEFCDPVTCMLMKDPVILPTSRTVMDRGSIMRHLLSDPRDPINRAPLQPEDLVEDVDMRKRIQQWKQERKSK